MIRAHEGQHAIRSMCRWLGVSASGYYAWKTRPESARAKANLALVVEMRAIHTRSRGSVGGKRMHEELVGRGRRCGRHRVVRLMRREGLRGKPKKRFRVTTDSTHALPVAPDLVQRNFTAAEPNRVWVSDITYIWTQEGWLYLAVLLDLFSRRVVGWSLGETLASSLVLDAIDMAAGRRELHHGWILHSDRGTQYASHAVRGRIAALGGLSSMSRRGNCFDNAVAESFFGSLKIEWLDGVWYETRAAAIRDVVEYMEQFYNHERLHSTLEYVTPAAFEKAAAQAAAVA